jgi:hypothetical protein
MSVERFMSDWAHQNDGLITGPADPQEDSSAAQVWDTTRRGWEWKAEGYVIERFVRPFDNETRFLVWRDNISVDICSTLEAAKRSALDDKGGV